MNKLTIKHLDDIKKLFSEYGAVELLLLPMWNKGKFVLNKFEWDILNEWINNNYKNIPLRISSAAKAFLATSYLFDDSDWDNDYGFIGIDKTLRKNSFTNEGLPIGQYDNFEMLLRDYKSKMQ